MAAAEIAAAACANASEGLTSGFLFCCLYKLILKNTLIVKILPAVVQPGGAVVAAVVVASKQVERKQQFRHANDDLAQLEPWDCALAVELVDAELVDDFAVVDAELVDATQLETNVAVVALQQDEPLVQRSFEPTIKNIILYFLVSQTQYLPSPTSVVDADIA